MVVQFSVHAAQRFAQRVCRINPDAKINLKQLGFKRSELKSASAHGECEYWFYPDRKTPLVLVVAACKPLVVTVLNDMTGVVPAVYAAA